MRNISRRSFLQSSAALAGGTSLFALTGPSVLGDVVGANERVRLAIIGAGGRGREHINFFGKLPAVEIVGIADPNKLLADKSAEQIEKKYGTKATSIQDFRKLLDDKNVDAVSVASCNHWHSLMTILACQAGKDVYVEKPMSQNLFEGRKCVEAAAKYKRLVQHGTQRRSEEVWARATAAARSGKYGKLLAAKVYANRPRASLGFKLITATPETFDWNLWLGPAPKLEYHANLAPYNWHWFWDTGNGEIGNNGVHYFDLCVWAFGEKHPNSVISFGTRFVNDPENKYKDQAQTPNIQFVLYDFDGLPLIFESCNLAGPKDKWKPREEAEFITEQGFIRGANFVSKDGKTEKIDVEFQPLLPGDNFANFIEAVRNRDSVPLNAPITKGHYAAGICHWGNAAYRTGQPDSLKSVREKMGNNSILQESIDNVLANVQNVFQDSVKIEDIPFSVSRKLIIDREKEKFVDNSAADAFLTRTPRPPFVVPEQV
ncbi:NADH-dependent dehydrogenase [Planctomycetales bacterium]|nr:NADH-dependent dehydrogenase [Planctomycetales bacterium]